MEKVNCLICDKELDYEPGSNYNGNVYDAGFMLVSFHYGSRHDQCGFSGRADTKDFEKLLSCNDIEAFICDDCFEKKWQKMRGYDVHKRQERKKVC
jgi:hypothetical protein